MVRGNRAINMSLANTKVEILSSKTIRVAENANANARETAKFSGVWRFRRSHVHHKMFRKAEFVKGKIVKHTNEKPEARLE